jgi:hypothetical protein
MPFRTFNSWLFDGQKNTPIPKPKTNDDGKVIMPDILKYNSPITHTFVLAMFLKHGPLNYYLNEYFNNMNVRYLSREELFIFIKKCVQQFKIQKSQITFYPRQQKVILYEKLRDRVPLLKNDDIYLLCDLVEKSDNKDAIYDSLGMDMSKKTKLKKAKKLTSKKITLKKFLSDHFSTIKLK